jgi:hypothetical protein
VNKALGRSGEFESDDEDGPPGLRFGGVGAKATGGVGGFGPPVTAGLFKLSSAGSSLVRSGTMMGAGAAAGPAATAPKPGLLHSATTNSTSTAAAAAAAAAVKRASLAGGGLYDDEFD